MYMVWIQIGLNIMLCPRNIVVQGISSMWSGVFFPECSQCPRQSPAAPLNGKITLEKSDTPELVNYCFIFACFFLLSVSVCLCVYQIVCSSYLKFLEKAENLNMARKNWNIISLKNLNVERSGAFEPVLHCCCVSLLLSLKQVEFIIKQVEVLK